MRKFCNCFVWSCANIPCRGTPGAAPTSLWSGVVVKPQPHMRKYTFECGVVGVQVRKGPTGISLSHYLLIKKLMAFPNGLGPHQQSWCEDELSSTGSVWAAAKPVQAESWAARRGAPAWEDLHYVWKTASSKGIRAENGSNPTSLTDTAVSFIPWAKKEQPGMGREDNSEMGRDQVSVLAPIIRHARRCSGGWGLSLVKNTSSSLWQCRGDPTLYLGSRNVVLLCKKGTCKVWR